MVTGSRSKTDLQKSFHVAPDNGSTVSEKRIVRHIARNGITEALFSQDLLELIELSTYEFPNAIVNQEWAGVIADFMNGRDEDGALNLIEPSAFTVVPDTLFRGEDIPKYFASEGSALQGGATMTNALQHQNISVCSIIPEEVKTPLNGLNLIADVTPVIASLSDSTKPTAHIMIRAEHIDVFLFNGGLKLANRYSAEHENDILYFCVAAIEQCGFSLDTTVVSVSGQREKINRVTKLLSKYIALLEAPNAPKKLKVPYAFKDIQPAWCWPILNAHSCA